MNEPATLTLVWGVAIAIVALGCRNLSLCSSINRTSPTIGLLQCTSHRWDIGGCVDRVPGLVGSVWWHLRTDQELLDHTKGVYTPLHWKSFASRPHLSRCAPHYCCITNVNAAICGRFVYV